MASVWGVCAELNILHPMDEGEGIKIKQPVDGAGHQAVVGSDRVSTVSQTCIEIIEFWEQKPQS